MKDILRQFSEGVIDSLRIPDAFITICMDKELRWLNLKCFVLNGLLWLGTVLIYNAFTSMLFSRPLLNDDDNSKDYSVIWQALVTIVHLSMDLAHNSWVMFIYIATLVLTTFWVQDIFDHLMDVKIKQIQSNGDDKKLLNRVKFVPMTPKDLISDLFARTVIITIYILLCQFLCSVTVSWLATLIELVT